MSYNNVVNYEQSVSFKRLDAKFFKPEFKKTEDILEGYEFRRLGNIASDIHRGKQPDYADDGEIPVLRTVNVREYGFTSTRQKHVGEKFYRLNERGQVHRDDILLTSTGVGSLGRVCVYQDGQRYFADSHITIIRGIKGLHPFYVASFLQTEVGKNLIMRRYRGSSGQIEIYPDDVGSIPIPVLPNENRVKATNLQRLSRRSLKISRYRKEQASDSINSLVQIADFEVTSKKAHVTSLKSTVEAERLDARHFHPRYEGVREFLKRKFDCVAVGSVSEVLRGKTPSKYSEKGTPVIRSGDLDHIEDMSGVKRSNEEDLFLLKKGDVCISSIGYGSIGKSQVFDLDNRCATVGEVTVIRKCTLDPYYIQSFLQSDAGQLQIESWVRGATGQLHLYPKDVKKIIIPVIDTEKQRRFKNLHKSSRRYRQKSLSLLSESSSVIESALPFG